MLAVSGLMLSVLIFLILFGIFGAVFYNGFSLVSTTSVAQIHRPSVPLITAYNGTNRVRLTVIDGSDIPISFYVLSQCSVQDFFVSVEVSETVTVSFDSPTEKSKSLTEWYFLGNTTLTTTITTDVLPGNSTDQCIAFLVVFNDFDQFSNFIANSFINENSLFKVCISNTLFQTHTIIFDQESYYFLGLYSDIPAEVGTFSVHFSGSYLQYNMSTVQCSMEGVNCDFSANSFSEDACIVGFVPPVDVVFGVKEANVTFNTAALPDSLVDYVFFVPLICYILLFSVFIVIWLQCRRFCKHRSRKRQSYNEEILAQAQAMSRRVSDEYDLTPIRLIPSYRYGPAKQ